MTEDTAVERTVAENIVAENIAADSSAAYIVLVEIVVKGAAVAADSRCGCFRRIAAVVEAVDIVVLADTAGSAGTAVMVGIENNGTVQPCCEKKLRAFVPIKQFDLSRPDTSSTG